MNLFNRKNKRPINKIDLAFNKFSILEQMEEKGIISIDISSARVFISSTLASLSIGNEVSWTNFLTNVHQWFMFRESTELWNRYFKDIEIKAVRDARKKYALLTKTQIKEIQANARQSVNVSEVPAPEIKPFELVITSGTVFTKDSDIIVVGRYHDGKFTMQPYEDIAQSLKQ